ncbi:MAG TPA: carbamoyl phosphate synthase small subunit, partial [Flavobacteriia bacterium]|nr:carbamoyl phosphate synthase small subunit [Flavobacteriia bacterium]
MIKNSTNKAIILLQDGTIFYGNSVGIDGTSTGEICFNTGMTGYQEIFTDPSYFGQIMVTTNAHIGNYGVNPSETESDKVQISGLICRNFSHSYSSKKASDSLYHFLADNNIVAIENVDTRSLVRHIREKGAMNAVISTDLDIEKLNTILNDAPSMEGLELASKVSTNEPYFVGVPNATYKVAALDIGIKKNIISNLVARDCYVKVFPFNSTFELMQEFKPDGYFLSNGPGDPNPLKAPQQLAKEIISQDL